MKRVMMLFAFVCLYPYAFSQVSVSGIVTDNEGESLVGANVILEQTFKGTTTDLNGKFQFSHLPQGTYTLKVSYVGYKEATRKINATSDVTLTIQLEKSTIMADEVMVTATRAGQKYPVAYSSVKKEEIEKRNMGQDIPYLLSLSPSLITTSDAGAGVGYTGLRIRGTDANRINVTINGVPLNDAESHGVWWVNTPNLAGSADNIQIQRGVGTSSNGAASFGGTINVQTETLHKDAYARISSAAGSFNTLKNSANVGTGMINGKFTFDASLSKITSDGFIDRASSDLKSFYTSGAYYSGNTIIRLNVFSGMEKTYQAWNGVPKVKLENDTAGMLKYIADAGYNQQQAANLLNSNPRTYNLYTYDNETDNYQQDHYQLLFSHELSSSLNVNAAVHYTRGRGYYEQYRQGDKFSDYNLNPVFVGNDSLIINNMGVDPSYVKDNSIIKTDLVRQKWLDNYFYGLTYAANYRKGKTEASIGGSWNKYNGDHYGKIKWMQFASNSDINYQWYNGKGIKTDFNIFGKVNYQLTNRFNLFADLQFRTINYQITGIDDDLRDISQEHDFNFFNPKFGAHYNLSHNQNIQFSWGVANREPTRSNYTDTDPEKPYPTNETLNDYELGYNLNFTNAALSANLYYMDYNNQLVLTGEINDVGNPVMTNVKKSYRAGIELIAGARITHNLKINANATFSRNKIEDFTEYVDNWDYWNDPATEPYQRVNHLGTTDLAFSPDIIAGGQLSYSPVTNLTISLLSKYVSRQYIDNTASKERSLNPYFYNNILVNYSLMDIVGKELKFSIQLNNVLNAQYETNAWVYRYFYENTYSVLDGYFPQAGFNFLAGINISF
jgi:iron complex outermembrane receptor protein